MYSQNHGGWKGPLEIWSPTSLPQHRVSQSRSSRTVEVGLKYLWGWRLHSFSGWLWPLSEQKCFFLCLSGLSWISVRCLLGLVLSCPVLSQPLLVHRVLQPLIRCSVFHSTCSIVSVSFLYWGSWNGIQYWRCGFTGTGKRGRISSHTCWQCFP